MSLAQARIDLAEAHRILAGIRDDRAVVLAGDDHPRQMRYANADCGLASQLDRGVNPAKAVAWALDQIAE